MALQDEITRIKQAKADIKSVLNEKLKIDVGNGTIDTYAPTIRQAEIGGGGSADLSEYFIETYTDKEFKFSYCIKKMPPIEITKITSVDGAFSGFRTLKEAPALDTSEVTNFRSMFYQCYELEKVYPYNTSKGTDFSNMVAHCRKLTEIPLFDTSNGTNFSSMFSNTYVLAKLPAFDTSNGTNFNNMFELATGIIEIPEWDFSKANRFSNMFSYTQKLVDLGGFKNLGMGYTQKSANYSYYTFNLSTCTKLTHDSLMNVINKLYDLNLTYDVANGGTLYTQKLVLGSTNLAKLTADEINLATQKGWSVS